MRAGELTKRAGVNFETLRYYESVGVLPEPRRASNGYRVYDERHLELLEFVQSARELGFTLEQVAQMTALEAGASLSCRDVADLASEQLKDVRNRIRSLRGIEKKLNSLVDS
ncbi:MAG: MerR family transcriptional regulator [Planctomycetes bacterium]|nr:MerR family transcriptional regulator [Planctomycetota bacterium]